MSNPEPFEPGVRNVIYKPGPLTEYERERCRLDVFSPPGPGPHPIIVWFHGGGLTGGDKDEARPLAESLAARGFVVVAPSYRLSPTAKFPAYVHDATDAVAWTARHAAEVGGDARRLFVGGYSAGGYLACMVAMDRSLLARHDPPADIRGLIAVSPQTFTHWTVRGERGVPEPTTRPTIDDAAPVFHAHRDAPPTLVLIAEHDLPTRLEEAQYFIAVLKAFGHRDASCVQIPDRDHGTIFQNLTDRNDPARRAIDAFLASH